MPYITPKLDWNENDYYNANDLNRVENNTAEVVNFLASIQYNVPAQTYVTNRDMTSIDFISSINRIEQNIEDIRNSFLTPIGWQEKKTWTVSKGFSYQDANRLESNIELLYLLAHIAKDNLIYCGTFSCGAEWEGGLY